MSGRVRPLGPNPADDLAKFGERLIDRALRDRTVKMRSILVANRSLINAPRFNINEQVLRDVTVRVAETVVPHSPNGVVGGLAGLRLVSAEGVRTREVAHLSNVGE